MRNRNNNILTKISKIIAFMIVILIIMFFISPNWFKGEYLFYATIPNYKISQNFNTIFSKKNDVHDIISDIDIFEFDFTEAFNKIEPEDNNNIFGLNDIIFQDEPEFRPFLDSSYKENLTEEDLDKLRNVDYLINAFYAKDRNAGIIGSRFNVDNFINTDLRLKKNNSNGPQVLIFHTHGGTEFFIDSNPNDVYTGVVGAGVRLKHYLENKYNISVMHHTVLYDIVNGSPMRGGSYERMEIEIQKILDENPSIELVIDVHRDGIEPNPHLVTYIDEKPYAKLMFVNGVSALAENGGVRELSSLPNPNLDTNLALSFNMQIAANKFFPDLTRRIYLKAYRFSTHMRPRSLLVEMGSQYNTMEEAFNSMELLADLINEVVFDM